MKTLQVRCSGQMVMVKIIADDDDDDDDEQVRTNGPGHSNGKRGSHVSTVR